MAGGVRGGARRGAAGVAQGDLLVLAEELDFALGEAELRVGDRVGHVRGSVVGLCTAPLCARGAMQTPATLPWRVHGVTEARRHRDTGAQSRTRLGSAHRGTRHAVRGPAGRRLGGGGRGGGLGTLGDGRGVGEGGYMVEALHARAPWCCMNESLPPSHVSAQADLDADEEASIHARTQSKKEGNKTKSRSSPIPAAGPHPQRAAHPRTCSDLLPPAPTSRYTMHTSPVPARTTPSGRQSSTP